MNETMAQKIMRMYHNNVMEIANLALECYASSRRNYQKYLSYNCFYDVIQARQDRKMAYAHVWDLCVISRRCEKYLVPSIDEFDFSYASSKGTKRLTEIEDKLKHIIKINKNKKGNTHAENNN